MLKITNAVSDGLTIKPSGFAFFFAGAPMELGFPNVFLEKHGELNLLAFANQMRFDDGEKVVSHFASCIPAKLATMVGVSLAVVIDLNVPFEAPLNGTDNREVGHSDERDHLEANVAAGRFLPNGDSDHAFSVEQSRKVRRFHISQVRNEMAANSVDIRCPVLTDAEGQYRAKQGESPGVCNEQVQPPEGEICSELGRNVETSAEMTGAVDVISGIQITSIGNRLQHGLFVLGGPPRRRHDRDDGEDQRESGRCCHTNPDHGQLGVLEPRAPRCVEGVIQCL